MMVSQEGILVGLVGGANDLLKFRIDRTIIIGV